MVLAPERFSTTTGWPSESESFAASSRAMMSCAAPAWVGTISRIGRLGKVSADAGRALSAATRVAVIPQRT